MQYPSYGVAIFVLDNLWLNPAMPEGRIVVRDGQILLKDIGGPMSTRQFAIFAEEEKHLGESDFGLDFFTQSNIYEYVRWLKRRGVSDSTCNMRIGQLTAFLKYLRKNPEYRMYYLDIKEVTRMKVSKHRRDVLPLSKAAIRAVESVSGRIDEILSITVKDLKKNAPKPNVTVIGKGRKARTLYIMKPVENCFDVIYFKIMAQSQPRMHICSIQRPKDF